MSKRKRARAKSADWNAIGALMTLHGMTEEEEARFRWSHPELEGKRMGPARTDAERSYEIEIYRRLEE